MPELTIIQLNDLHGYLAEHPEWLWVAPGLRYETMGGLARIRTVVDEIRARGLEQVLTMQLHSFDGRAVKRSQNTNIQGH